ncbi:HTH domain-containing protein [Lactiplantibacillus plantarum]|uniref:HTH domain-containing protein n=1 Tax=Lactiplantibacillus plantarum TaxID=1590 RepID=UPI0007B5457D|nr:helix-turn-helix domain-containing protein [Lactiplantibacillus plantarum]KZU77848.1 Biotin--protein ligase [Lactiplantibacillus plantarum]
MKNKSTQEKVVLELLTNLDTWVSGDYLAKKFQVSRETIWKTINNLKVDCKFNPNFWTNFSA